MNNTHKISLGAMITLFFLLPLFFLPTMAVPLGVSKVILLTILLGVGLVALLVDTFNKEEITLPKHYILLPALLIPVVYLISAQASATKWLSMYGYIFESGTAVSIVILFAILFVSTIVFGDRDKIFKVYTAIFASLSVLALFALVKVLSGGEWLVLNNFAGNMGNPVGAWTDYALVFGLLALLSLLSLAMLSLKGVTKLVMVGALSLSIFLLAVIGFSTAWVLVLIFSSILLIYFATVEKSRNFGDETHKGKGMLPAVILVVISLIFFFNPVVSPTSGALNSAISNFFGVSNTYVRPTLSTTLQISKAAIVRNPVLGSGPNTFSKNWLLDKPIDVNNTPFWNIAFPFGLGFIPTQIASTGLLGAVAWAIFFVALLMLAFKAFTRSPDDRFDRFLVLGSLIASLFLWLSFFVYMPSLTVLAIAFAFTGLFISSCVVTGVIGQRTILFSKNAISHFFSVLIIVALALGTLAFAFVAYQKVASQIHYQRALVEAGREGGSLENVEASIVKAINLSPVDTFWTSLSEVELAKANSALNATTSTAEENGAVFQQALGRSISYIQEAIALNPSYSNWLTLGNVYRSLVPAPLSVAGAYDQAKSAYESARALNPNSPELPLLLARIELDNKNADAARELVNEAIDKKADYADAYFFLAQLEVGEGNISQAIRSAETVVLLSPGNPGVLFQLGVLKYENRDYTGAVEALKESVRLVPDYANAKFYLGLSLDALNRREEAIKEFEALSTSNPENELVTSILANLKANKRALAGLEDSGNTAPISGQ